MSDDTESLTGGQPDRLIGNATLGSSIKALLIKRFHLYKRDKTAICCEVVVPFMCVLIGCILNNINFSQKSYTLLVEPSMYPSPQRILMNDQAVTSGSYVDQSIDPNVLYNNLPGTFGADGNWDGQFNSSGIISTQFYNKVYDLSLSGNPNPYRYGSYEIYRSDLGNQQYEFATMMNITSAMVTAYYPQFMYESILKSAVNVDMNLNTVPFPTMYQLSLRSSSQNAFGYGAYVGFAFCFMPCAIISFIVMERVENLRHMQVVSGMPVLAYWMSNMIADMVKMYIPILTIMLMSVAFDSLYAGTWALFLLLPPALVPFTYCTSFIFEKDSAAQIVTLFISYFINCIMPILVFVLQFIPQTFTLGGILRWSLCIFPSYCVINGILWSSSGEVSIQVRKTNPDYPQLSDNIWAMSNLGGDALILVLHFFVDSFILYLIEIKAFDFIRKLKVFSPPEKQTDLKLDEDVLKEEERVRQNKTDVIRVSDFRKAY